MKRLFLSAIITALSSQSLWAQTVNDQYTLENEDTEITNTLATIVRPGEDRNDSEDLQSTEVISLGTRIGYNKIDDLTSPTSIITDADIIGRGHQYISSLLRALPSIAVSQSGPASGLTQIRLRGSEANHVLVLIDGVEVANPSGGEFDFSGLRTEDVERVEVLRGEQSALYGSDAIGGVINIITRAGRSQTGWNASVEAGSFETLEGQISTVLPLSGLLSNQASLSINGNAFTTKGYDVSGLGGEDDGSRSRALNIGFNNVALGPVTISAKFGTSNLDVEFDGDSDFDGRLNDTADETTVKTQTGRIDARFKLANFDHLITAHMVDTDTDTQGGFSSRSIGQRQNINWAAKRQFGSHRLTLLTEAEHESYEITPNFTEAGAEPDNWTYGFAGDYSFNQGPVTITASARHDVNDLFQDATTWRIGGGYNFESFGGRLRGSVGTGVKNPSLIELFGFFPTSRFTGNRDLQPETSLGYSLGYEQKLGGLNLSIDYFRSELEDEIATIFNPDFTSTVVNVATDSTREGIEIEAQYKISETLSLRASASFLESDQNDIEEIRRPEFLGSFTGTWQIIDPLALTLSVDHTGSQLDTDFASFSNVILDAFTLVGLNARFTVNDRVTLNLRGENLLNEDYEEIVGFASQGRGVFAGVSARF